MRRWQHRAAKALKSLLTPLPAFGFLVLMVARAIIFPMHGFGFRQIVPVVAFSLIAGAILSFTMALAVFFSSTASALLTSSTDGSLRASTLLVLFFLDWGISFLLTKNFSGPTGQRAFGLAYMAAVGGQLAGILMGFAWLKRHIA